MPSRRERLFLLQAGQRLLGDVGDAAAFPSASSRRSASVDAADAQGSDPAIDALLRLDDDAAEDRETDQRETLPGRPPSAGHAGLSTPAVGHPFAIVSS
jgi:hypothetical protein